MEGENEDEKLELVLSDLTEILLNEDEDEDEMLELVLLDLRKILLNSSQENKTKMRRIWARLSSLAKKIETIFAEETMIVNFGHLDEEDGEEDQGEGSKEKDEDEDEAEAEPEKE